MKLNLKLTVRGEAIALNNLKKDADSRLDDYFISDVPMIFFDNLWRLKSLQGNTRNFFVQRDYTKYRSKARAMKALDKMYNEYILG